MSDKPNPSMSGKDIVSALKKMSLTEAAAFIEANYTKIQAADLAVVSGWANGQINAARSAPGSGVDLEALSTLQGAISKADSYTTFNSDQTNLDSKADKAVADGIAGNKVNNDINGNGVIDAEDTKNIEAAKARVAKVHQEQTGQPTTAADVDKAATKGGTKPSTATPRWVLDKFTTLPGFAADLTHDQKNRVVDTWNEAHGTTFTWDQLVTQTAFQDPTTETTNLVQGAVLDDQPTTNYGVSLADGRNVTLVGDSDHPGFVGGVALKDAIKTVRYADAFGLKASDGTVAWQPLAALIKAQNLTDDPTYEALKAVVAEQSNGNNRVTSPIMVKGGGLPAQSVARGMIDPKARLDAAKKDLADYERLHPEVVKKDSMKLGPINLPVVQGFGVSKIVAKYKAGLDKYGDPSMAYLDALDPALAARLFASGGDVSKLDQRDVLSADQLMFKGGWDPKKLASQGYAGGTGIGDFLDNLAAKARALKADAPPVRTFHDPAEIKQSVRSLWNAMFRQDPSPQMMDTFAAEIHQMEARATVADQSKGINGQDVNVDAQLRTMLQGTALYKQLYGNKGNMTDEAYQGQFVGGNSDMLGSQVDNEAILAGMRSGQYGTTVGAAGVTGVATNNSRFLQNLASAAGVLNNMT